MARKTNFRKLTKIFEKCRMGPPRDSKRCNIEHPMKDIKQLIREAIRRRGPLREVARTMRLDHSNLIHVLSEESNPELKTLERIADHLGYSLTLKKKGGQKRKE